MPRSRAPGLTDRPAGGLRPAGDPPRRRARWWAPVVVACGAGLVAACGPTSPGPAASGSAAAPASAPPTESSPSTAAYSGDPGPGWKLTWSDDFTGAGALRDWTFANGGNGWGNKELQVYDSRNVSLAPGGGLVITAAKDGHGEQCWYGTCTYSGARLQTKGIFAQKYGLFEARIKLPTGRGLWPAFWMEGADIDQVNWPASGEIDVIEINNKKPNLVEAFAHATNEKYGAYYQLPESLSAGYHIYGIDWTASGITWLVDGHAYGHISAYQGWPFDQPFFLILDLAVGGTWPGSPDASTTFPAHMDVSWIRAYQEKS
jgi:beta-glucanase (GH16 family)